QLVASLHRRATTAHRVPARCRKLRARSPRRLHRERQRAVLIRRACQRPPAREPQPMTRRASTKASRMLAFATASALLLAGCSLLPQGPGAVPTDWVPEPTTTPATSTVGLSPDGFTAAQRMTVRMRNIGCQGLVHTGSGFALDA